MTPLQAMYGKACVPTRELKGCDYFAGDQGCSGRTSGIENACKKPDMCLRM
jgi:hypothetical protein